MAKRYEHYKVWLDGEMVAPENAKVSVFTSTATRGANVYEGIRAYWSEEKNNLFVWKLDPHLKRLFQSMKIMRVTPPLTYEQYKEAALNWARGNGFREDVHFRLVTYFGDGGTGEIRMYKPDEIEFGVWINGGPRKHNEALDKGIDVCVSSWRRINDDSMPAPHQSGLQLPEQPACGGRGAGQRIP